VKLRPIYCLAIASLVSAPVTWYVWTEQSPLERELVSLVREFDFEEIDPASVGHVPDTKCTFRTFASRDIDSPQARKLAKRFDEVSRKYDASPIDMCGFAMALDYRIQWVRESTVKHNGRFTWVSLHTEEAEPRRLILSIEKQRTSLADRLPFAKCLAP
jgi:hypothetical protein